MRIWKAKIPFFFRIGIAAAVVPGTWERRERSKGNIILADEMGFGFVKSTLQIVGKLDSEGNRGSAIEA